MENTHWNGFEKKEFLFEDREAIVVFPELNTEDGQWLFKMEYWDAFSDLEIEMVKRGWHLAFIKNKTRWCLEEDLDLKKRFADYIMHEYNLKRQCVPVGMSCGGMFSVKFAAKYPEYIDALYLDAPVMNLLSCPADLGVASSGLFHEFEEATGMTVSELICYREHPMDKISQLLSADIPVVLVYGKEDTIVPYCENGAILEQAYKKLDGILFVIGKDNCGHHPHGLEDPNVIADFLVKVSK